MSLQEKRDVCTVLWLEVKVMKCLRPAVIGRLPCQCDVTLACLNGLNWTAITYITKNEQPLVSKCPPRAPKLNEHPVINESQIYSN